MGSESSEEFEIGIIAGERPGFIRDVDGTEKPFYWKVQTNPPLSHEIWMKIQKYRTTLEPLVDDDIELLDRSRIPRRIVEPLDMRTWYKPLEIIGSYKYLVKQLKSRIRFLYRFDPDFKYRTDWLFNQEKRFLEWKGLTFYQLQEIVKEVWQLYPETSIDTGQWP